MKQIFSYWILPISEELRTLHAKMIAFTNAKKIVIIALLSALAASFNQQGLFRGSVILSALSLHGQNYDYCLFFFSAWINRLHLNEFIIIGFTAK